MRGIEVSGHITAAVAMEHIAAAAHNNPSFEDRSAGGWDVEFVDAPVGVTTCQSERLARVVSCNRERTVVAVAIVGPADI